MSPTSDTRYRIFVPESEHDKLPADTKIEESYPAFAIVTAPDAAIAEVRKQYPVEQFPEPKAPPAVPQMAGISAAVHEEKTRGPYTLVVRFRNPVRSEWLAELAAIGCEQLGALGSSTIVVSCPSKRIRTRLSKLAYVGTVRPYVPEIKISSVFYTMLAKPADGDSVSAANASPGVDTAKGFIVPGVLVASFFREEDRKTAQRKLERAGIGAANPSGATDLVINLITSTQSDARLSMLSTLHNLRSLQEKTIDVVRNDLARHTLAGSAITSPPTGLGLTGKGEIVAVADTGLDTGNLATMHLDFRGRVRHITSLPFADSSKDLMQAGIPDDGAADLFSGHGTHVCGSVLGNGQRATQLKLKIQIQGTAPEAELVLQAIEKTVSQEKKQLWVDQGLTPPESGLFGIPDNLQDLLQAAFDQGARIHSDSWNVTGRNEWGNYNNNSENLDQFVSTHRDFLMVVSAGNEAMATVPRQKPGSVVSPGTAKNCITVGACGNSRNGSGIDQIADFSSRGPTAKGRQKPDVVAPGLYVLSTRSSCSKGDGWGKFSDAPKDYFFDSGTSMATPLVAGCAALVRQYLRKTLNITQPSAALVKAIIIHSAQYIRTAATPPGQFADNVQGWGRVNLDTVLNPQQGVRVLFFDIDAANGLTTGAERRFQIQVAGPTAPLRLTLAYTDPLGADLINNLNLIVRAPSGSFFVGNDFAGTGAPDGQNNVEGILVPQPEPGIWTIQVIGSNIPQPAQDFALVVSAAGLQTA